MNFVGNAGGVTTYNAGYGTCNPLIWTSIKYTTLPRMSPCGQGEARTASFYYSLVYDRDQPHLFTSVQI